MVNTNVPTEPELNPLLVLREAIKTVPAVKYALGLAGIAAAGAIVTTFTAGNTTTTIIILGALFVGMILLFLFSSIIVSEKSTKSGKVAGQVLMWSVTLFFVIFLGFTTSAAGWGVPCNWARVLGFQAKCDTPGPDPSCPLTLPLQEYLECNDAK